MIKLVLTDVDGTLIPLGKEVSQHTMRSIATLRDAGVRFGLSTGRDLVELTRLFRGDTTPFQTGVLSNGKKIMVDGELVRLELIDNSALGRMAELIKEYPTSFVTAYPLETDETNPVYCMGVKAEDIGPWSKVYAFSGIAVDEVPDFQIIGATIACQEDQGVMDEIKRRGAELCPEFDFAQPAPHWCDILPKGLNKGVGFGILLNELGVARDEAVVFGDADNDLAILREADHSVAVENATAAVKAAARWHIGNVDDEAVAEALVDIAQATCEGRMPSFMQPQNR